MASAFHQRDMSRVQLGESASPKQIGGKATYHDFSQTPQNVLVWCTGYDFFFLHKNLLSLRSQFVVLANRRQKLEDQNEILKKEKDLKDQNGNNPKR